MLEKLNVHDYAALLSFIIGLGCYKKLKNTPFAGFVPILAFTIIVEWGCLLGHFKINSSNHWIYNILTTIHFVFFFYLFHKFLDNSILKRIAFWMMFLFPLAVVFNCIFFQGFNQFQTNTYIAGSLLMIVCACSYFYQLLQSPKEMKLFKIPFFWISTGLLFFYAGQFVLMAVFPHLAYAKDKTFKQIFNTVVYNLNILLYCCFIIAFLCQRKIANSIPPSSPPPS